MFKCHKSYAEDVSPVYISINQNTQLLSGAVAPNAASDAVKCKNIKLSVRELSAVEIIWTQD